MEVISIFPIGVGRFFYENDLSTIKEYIEKNIANDVIVNTGNTTSKNVEVLELKEFEELKKFINSSVKEYFDNIICADGNIEPYVTLSWINFTEQGQFHHKHWHGNSILSGVFYINAVAEHDKINFYHEKKSAIELTPKSYNLFNSTAWWIPVKEGDLILFPSDLEHGVDTVKFDHTRVSLAFNVFVRGEFGNKHQLKWLSLK